MSKYSVGLRVKMLKDKELIGRICRNIGTSSSVDFTVLKVVRSESRNILAFEIAAKNLHSEKSKIVQKDCLRFQVDGNWISGSDLIIHLLEQKINTLRRQIKISSSKKN